MLGTATWTTQNRPSATVCMVYPGNEKFLWICHFVVSPSHKTTQLAIIAATQFLLINCSTYMMWAPHAVFDFYMGPSLSYMRACGRVIDVIPQIEIRDTGVEPVSHCSWLTGSHPVASSRFTLSPLDSMTIFHDFSISVNNCTLLQKHYELFCDRFAK